MLGERAGLSTAWVRRVMDGFYRQTGEDVTEYTPTDLWLTQNLSHRLDETIGRELELLSDHNSKA